MAVVQIQDWLVCMEKARSETGCYYLWVFSSSGKVHKAPKGQITKNTENKEI